MESNDTEYMQTVQSQTCVCT